MNELWRHRDAARQALAVVDLIAPPKVRSLGRRAVEAGEILNVNVTSHRAEGVSDDFREGRTALSEAMREDLGLQATAEVAEKRNQRLSANQMPLPTARSDRRGRRRRAGGSGPARPRPACPPRGPAGRSAPRRCVRAARATVPGTGLADSRDSRAARPYTSAHTRLGPAWGCPGGHHQGGVTWRDIACAAQARPGASDANRPLPAGLAGRWPARCPAVTGVRAGPHAPGPPATCAPAARRTDAPAPRGPGWGRPRKDRPGRGVCQPARRRQGRRPEKGEQAG